MGNEQVPQQIEQKIVNNTDIPQEAIIQQPQAPKMPILQESDIKFFGKRWRTDHDKYEIGTVTICSDKTLTFVNSKTNIEKTIPISSLTQIAECTLTMEYPVTLLIISYKNNNAQSKQSIDSAILVSDVPMWLDVLHYQTNLEPKNIVHTPECPICLMEAEEYTYLVGCGHMICEYCLFNYIKSQIKDASKYPMKCFNFKCDAMLHMNDVQFAFSGLPDANKQENKQENKEEKDDDDNKDEEKQEKEEEKEEEEKEEKEKEKEKEVKDIGNKYAVKCICNKEMDKVNGNPYDADKPANIYCDNCQTKIDDKNDFYHCSMDKEDKHPQGYDICIDCGEVRQQTQNLKDEQIPNCECGDKLIAMMPEKCYGSKNGIVCNQCKQTFKDMIVWHCSKTFVEPHKNGYDLCIECGGKHTKEYKDNEEKRKLDDEKKKDEPIDMKLIENVMPEINYAKPTTKQDYTAIYQKFSVLCAMPESERDQCPKCEMIFFGEPRLKNANHHKWAKEEDAKFCANTGCNFKFKIVFATKLRCTLCGEIFCENCRNHKLELAKGSDAAQKKYIASKKVKQHKSKLSVLGSFSDGIKNIFKSDEDIKADELAFEQKELQKTTSEEKKEIVENTVIDCCNVCWLQYYRGLCGECNYEYCLECRQEWHPNIDCVEEKRKKESKEYKEAENDKLNEQFFAEQGFVKCPRCGVIIEKTSGCNAIPHKCKLKNETKYTHIYVCHCCGEYLKDHDHEKDGTNHFPDGPFAICRIKKKK